jgi:Zn-dependent protease
VGQNVRLGRVAGIPVGANWSVAVILVIIADILAVSVLPADVPHRPTALYWLVAIVAAALFLACLLAHELAHALVARRNGVGVRSITLWMLGGVAELEGDPPSAAADLRIALAGPAASLAAGGVFLAAAALIGQARGPAVVVAAASWLAVMNGVLAVFNLLPGAPLDGGRCCGPSCGGVAVTGCAPSGARPGPAGSSALPSSGSASRSCSRSARMTGCG